MKYWDCSSDLFEAYEHYRNTRVPAQGMADSLGGELLRAMSNIYYDAYNNGFGNNQSGALAFINENLPQNIKDPGVRAAISYLEDLVNTTMCVDVNCEVGNHLDHMMDVIVMFNRDDTRSLNENTIDHLDLDDEDADGYF